MCRWCEELGLQEGETGKEGGLMRVWRQPAGRLESLVGGGKGKLRHADGETIEDGANAGAAADRVVVVSICSTGVDLVDSARARWLR